MSPQTIPIESRRQRIKELVLVLAVAFLPGIVTSLYAVTTRAEIYPSTAQGYGTGGWLDTLCQFGLILAVFGYVLGQQGRSVRDIGFRWRGRDIGWSLLLFVAASLVFWIGEWLLYYVAVFVGHPIYFRRHNLGFRSGPNSGLGFVFLLAYSTINPFVEELIVRAYLMSEVKALTGSTILAIILSVTVQISYHFYQGFWTAITFIPLFLVFSLFYARTGRILPVLLAHLYFDLLAAQQTW